MKITTKTKVIGIFGDPIEHSLSPPMQNAAIKSLGLDMIYIPWHVKPQHLEMALNGVRAMGIRGINLTIPHKERALNYIDSVSDEVGIIGATNTIVNDRGKLVGYNTDGKGLLLALKKEYTFMPKGKKIVIIGAGGAARGIAAAMAAEGATTVIIANRTLGKAESLASEFSLKIRSSTFEGIDLSSEKLSHAFKNAHLLVNASSAGMVGENDLDLPLEQLTKETIVVDIVYKPLITSLLRDAEGLGLRTQGGLDMLACQGEIAFELFTGQSPPVNAMLEALQGEFK
ncbi:MAG: shikimate dehydrogenase [Proteobacteria bacterium]|nr:shikimate dehydrogenase [Pseudomonadota bacterium]